MNFKLNEVHQWIFGVAAAFSVVATSALINGWAGLFLGIVLLVIGTIISDLGE